MAARRRSSAAEFSLTLRVVSVVITGAGGAAAGAGATPADGAGETFSASAGGTFAAGEAGTLATVAGVSGSSSGSSCGAFVPPRAARPSAPSRRGTGISHRGPLGSVVPMLSLRRDAAGRLQARIGWRRMACRRERDCRDAHRDSGDQMQRASCLFLHESPGDLKVPRSAVAECVRGFRSQCAANVTIPPPLCGAMRDEVRKAAGCGERRNALWPRT